MIQSSRGLLTVAAVTLVLSLLILFPARVAYQWANFSGVVLSGIQGTVWRGNADAVSASGVVLQDLRWRFKPLRLFLGRFAYRIDASPASGFVEGVVDVQFGNRLSVSGLNAMLPLPVIAVPLRIKGLDGAASVKFDRFTLRDGLPVAAEGIINVSDLVAPKLGREPVGSFRAEFFTQDEGIAASVEDADAVVDLAGSLQVNEDGSYRLIAQIAPKPAAPAEVKRQLQMLGAANERGQYELRIEGAL